MANGESLTGNGEDWTTDEHDRNGEETLTTDWKTSEPDQYVEPLTKTEPADQYEESLTSDWKTAQPDNGTESVTTDWEVAQPSQNVETRTTDFNAARPNWKATGFAGDWKTARLDRNAMEKFISTVKLYPVLYNVDMEGYKDLEMKETIWKEVAAQCNFKSERDAKHHWKKVRDCLREALKRQRFPLNPRTGRRKRNWKYQRQLDFLKPFLTQRMGQQDPPNNRDGNQSPRMLSGNQQPQMLPGNLNPRMLPENQPSRMGPGPSVAPVAKEPAAPMESEVPSKSQSDAVLDFLVRHSEARQDKHPLDLFFASMCESTKNLSPVLQAKVKARLFEVVSLAEAEQLNSRWCRN